MESEVSRVVVITGGGSGIGKSLAKKAASDGMRVLIADIDADSLFRVKDELEAAGGEILAKVTDVSDFGSVCELASLAFEEFGQVNILFNNAGVLVNGVSWERSIEDWRWSFDVNVMGVVHGIKAFVPRMIAQKATGTIVNTASIAGLLSGSYFGPYCSSKHAVVALTEALQHELKIEGANLRAAVLCPGEVATNIFNSEYHRPLRYGAGNKVSAKNSLSEKLAESNARGVSPDELAGYVFREIALGKFWLFSQTDFKSDYSEYHMSIIDEKTPPDFTSRH